MTKPRTYKTEAVIIKKTKLGEADRILTLYTPNLGKIQAVAKGGQAPPQQDGRASGTAHPQPDIAGARAQPRYRNRRPDHQQLSAP
jgi:hypothetical protein